MTKEAEIIDHLSLRNNIWCRLCHTLKPESVCDFCEDFYCGNV